MESNQQTTESSDWPREHKLPKRKHKHKHKHKHHRRRGNDFGYERKLSTVTDKPELEILANEEDINSPAIPLVTVDEHDAKKDATTETNLNPEDNGDQHSNKTKRLVTI